MNRSIHFSKTFLRPTSWLFVVLTYLIIFAACSKDKGTDELSPTPDDSVSNVENTDSVYKDWPVPPVLKKDEINYITFYTETTQEQEINIGVGGEGWIDLNNNGLQDTDEKKQTFNSTYKKYKLNGSVITLYGDITTFAVYGANVKAIEVSHCSTLRVLYVQQNKLSHLNLTKNTSLIELSLYNNQFTADAMLAMVKTLPQRQKAEEASIYLETRENVEGNVVSKEVLDILAAKNWNAKYLDKEGKPHLYNGNPKAPDLQTIDLGWPVNPVINESEASYISLFLDKSKKEELYVLAEGLNWVDLNNNAREDIDDKIVQIFGEKGIVPQSQCVTFYGTIKSFTLGAANLPEATVKYIDLSHCSTLETLKLSRHALKAIDFSNNLQISTIDISMNQLNSEAMLAMVKSIPNRKGKTAGTIILYSQDDPDEGNVLVEEALNILGTKNWVPKYIDEHDNIQDLPLGDYGIFIGEHKITSANFFDINSKKFPALESGKVTYDPINNVLTLDGATFRSSIPRLDVIRQLERQGKTSDILTIKLIGENRIISNKKCIVSYNVPIRITGQGKLIANANDYAIVSGGKDLIIDGGCTIEAFHSVRAANYKGMGGTLYINGANVHAQEEYPNPVFAAPKGIVLSGGSQLVYPVDATIEYYYDENAYVYKEKGLNCSEVRIEVR